VDRFDGCRYGGGIGHLYLDGGGAVSELARVAVGAGAVQVG